MNPIDALFRAFHELVPAPARRVTHAVLTALFAILTLWLAAEGDLVALLTLVATAYTASNAANTFEPPGDSTVLEDFEGFEPHDEHNLTEVDYIQSKED